MIHGDIMVHVTETISIPLTTTDALSEQIIADRR